MAEKKEPSIFPLMPGRPRVIPEDPKERKSGPLGLGLLEQIPRPLKEMRERRGRYPEK